VVCGASSDAGKSWLVAGLCRLLARRGVRVAPFKGQNMALNAAVTVDGCEIGHAQWIQAVAAGVEPEAAMNPVLLKPTGDRTSDVIVMGHSTGVRSAADYQAAKPELFPVVLDALADLRSRFDVVICEGAGSAAEINLLDKDITNLPLAKAAGLPALVVGDIDRGGVFASLYGTAMILPDDLRATVRGFVINRLRGDPDLLGDACADLEARTGIPTLGVIPMVGGTDLDAEDSLAVPTWGTGGGADLLDVAVVRLPRMANFGDLDPLRLEPGVSVRWIRSAGELGRPHLVVIPGSKATVDDLAWLRSSGLAAAIDSAIDSAIDGSGASVVGICAGAQMCGTTLADPEGVESAPGTVDGLGWLPLATEFDHGKVLDRPTGDVVGGPGEGGRFAGYRIHVGRIRPEASAVPWLRSDTGEAIGWRSDRVLATSLHAVFEDDGLRRGVLRWAAARAGRPDPADATLSFEGARHARLDRIADTLEEHLDLTALFALIEEGA